MTQQTQPGAGTAEPEPTAPVSYEPAPTPHYPDAAYAPYAYQPYQPGQPPRPIKDRTLGMAQVAGVAVASLVLGGVGGVLLGHFSASAGENTGPGGGRFGGPGTGQGRFPGQQGGTQNGTQGGTQGGTLPGGTTQQAPTAP